MTALSDRYSYGDDTAIELLGKCQCRCLVCLGFARVPAEEFYGAAWHRLQAAKLAVPAPRFLKPRKER